MLQRILIENIALIDKLDLDLSPGFNVITGETGAGKSIIIDSVSLILGERASRGLIRSGSSKSKVEAVFDISGCNEASEFLNGLEIEYFDDELIISREIYVSGKSVCRLNGIPVTISALKDITSYLIDIHGQHEHQSLLSPSAHIRYLDAYAGAGVSALKERLLKLYGEYRRLKGELETGFLSEPERMRRIDALNFRINEINSADLKEGEEEALQEEQSVLANAERIMGALSVCHELLSGDEASILSKARSAADALVGISAISPLYKEAADRLNDAYYALEDVGYSVRDMQSSFEYDPKRLDEIGSRLYLIAGLKRKYGGGIRDILEFRNRDQEELERLTCADEARESILNELKRCENDYNEAAGELSRLRHSAAEKLSGEVEGHLADLGLKNARFSTSFETKAEFSPDGTDKVEFLLTSNSMEPLKPLAKVASGGEMSRIMLALKTIIAGSDNIPTLIFDEIDVGISGRISGMVGEKLVHTAAVHQVLCVTHSPQIAAYADAHIVVEKRDGEDGARTSVRSLTMDERKHEIARILGISSESESALRHAEEMLYMCGEKKRCIRSGG